MLARSSDEIVGRRITEFVASESIPPMLAGLAELRDVGDCTPIYPAQMIRIDGSLLAVEVVAVKTVWEDEVAYQVITRDVSARHAADAALRYEAALVNHVSDAIIATTETGLVTSWNPAAEAIYGRSVDEALGLPITALVGADVDPVAIVASGGILHTTHHSATGAALDVRVSAAAMEDGYVFVCCDLTALHRAEQHFEAVVETMAEGVIVTDKDGCIKSINPAAVRIIGAGPEHLGGDFFEITGQFPFYDAEGVNIPPRPTPRSGRASHRRAVLQPGVRDPPAEGEARVVDVQLPTAQPGSARAVRHADDVHRHHQTSGRSADKLVFRATHDELTKLPNRASVLRKINRALTAPHQYTGCWRSCSSTSTISRRSTTRWVTQPATSLLCSAAERLLRVIARRRRGGAIGRRRVRRARVWRCHPSKSSTTWSRRVRIELATPAVIGGDDHRDTRQHRRRRSRPTTSSGPPTRYCGMRTWRCTSPSVRAGAGQLGRTQRPEKRANVLDQPFGFFRRGEVAAARHPRPMRQVRITLGDRPWDVRTARVGTRRSRSVPATSAAGHATAATVGEMNPHRTAMNSTQCR